ncbi:MAG: lysoplasmalogenase [Verrucomicrobiota bacterium]
MTKVPIRLVIAYVVCGALALIGCEFDELVFKGLPPQAGTAGAGSLAAVMTNQWWILKYAFKPLTTVLLFQILGPPRDKFQKCIALGIFFSLVGDVALLWSRDAALGDPAFAVGLLGFLAAHISYIVAFRRVGRRSPRALAAAVMLAATTVLVVVNWPHLHQVALRIAVPVYAAALGTMVTTAWSTDRARLNWATPAAIGAFLFFIGDASLALDAFYWKDVHGHGIPHAWLLTIGVYWVGQLGIATTARAGTRNLAADSVPS